MKSKRWVAPAVLLLAASCSHRHDKEIVAQQYVHSYGVEVEPHDWHSRGKNGQVIVHLDTGEKVTETYVDGVLHGETTTTFPHQQTICHVQRYHQGTLFEETFNDSHGNPLRRVRFLAKNHQRISLWFENGAPQSVEEWVDRDLVKGDYYNTDAQVETRVVDGEGLRTNRDQFGLHLSTEKVHHGSVIERTLYYPNGAPKEMIPLQNDLVHGLKKTYLPSGEPQSVEEWVKGKQQGITTLYRNGEKVAEVPYLNGKKEGLEHRYSDGVKIVEEINWKNDQRHGRSRVYVASTVKDQWYFKGQAVTKNTYDRLMLPQRP